MRFTPTLLLLVGLMGCDGAAQPAKPAAKDKPNASQEAAVAAIKKLGGRVTIDTKSPEKPVTTVYLYDTQVTDSELVHLKGLMSLQTLDLRGTQVTDTGLAHLKGLTSLQTLFLSGTRVTDAGLVHLKDLTSLQKLIVIGTQVTDAGVEELRAALPECTIVNQAM